MANIFHHNLHTKMNHLLSKASLSVLTAAFVAAPLSHAVEAIAAPASPQIVAQLPQDWQTGVQLLRLLDNSGNLSSVGILFDVVNKPATSYANVVYQLYVKRSGEWREVYTNSGARLINKNAGRYTMPVEVIPLNLLSEKISLNDLYNGDLKAVTSVRYDIRNSVKDAKFEIEEVRSFSSIVAMSQSEAIAGRFVTVGSNSTSTNISNNSSSNSSSNSSFSDRELGLSNSSQTTTQTTQTTTVQTNRSYQTMKPIVVSSRDDDEDDDYEGDQRNRQNRDGVELSKANPHRGHFSLVVLQNQPRLSEVVARISVKSKRPKGFLNERFVGDYRLKLNQRATFIRGLNPGDRLIVRLFDLQNRPLGYSEVQLLKNFAAVHLILPSDPAAYGTLRTVSGIDSQRVGKIDRNVKVYDYFTQIQTGSTLTDTVARFLTTSQGIPVNLFNVTGLSPVPNQFSYTNAFIKGDQTLINRAISMFTRDMPPVMQVLPGQLTSLIPITNSQPIDVVRKILDYKDLRPNGLTTFF